MSILKHPDYPGLVDLVVADLKTKESRGFGSFGIHRALLPGQLEELREKMPELIRNTNYVHTVISKMLPSEDINWKADRKAFGAYLERVWGFVRNLEPAFNSLKANTLHQLLSWHRENGNYPKDLFMEYVKMPRSLHYVNPDYLKGQTIEVRNHLVDLNRDFQQVNHCPPVGNDEALLRAFFLHYFIQEATFIPYAKYIRDTWLKPVFAEAKIVNGVGDQEKWFAMLSPAAYQALKERIDIEFAATNPKAVRARRGGVAGRAREERAQTDREGLRDQRAQRLPGHEPGGEHRPEPGRAGGQLRGEARVSRKAP